MQILLVEDDDRVARFIAKGLGEAGHLTEHAADGREGMLKAAAETYDVLILDRMLPYVDGLTILQTLRATENHVPVLILSALSHVDERVKGLRAGGDDYLTKPFALSELVARVEILGRRKAVPAEHALLTVAGLEVDLLAHEVRRMGRRIDVTPREFRILEYLARNAGRVVTRSMLLEAVWDYHFDPQTNIIDQHVSKLRQKIDLGFDRSLIETVRGSGYRMRSA